ncbi:E3 ubiquitin-protein ligase RNF14 [Frankliniella fusca]|uniref:RBR-type E3 ubiquitin transferase n=1 Tax=Frankliniella fusca TaxID=407009 RepID=A0AAE1H4A3_9NEOP|nr:E3 ubiquitin-protein ligase RNF14 [Frankliniella fusca]
MSNNIDAQNDEMLALASIYDTDEFSYKKEDGEFSGQFKAFVTLPGDEEIKLQYRFESLRSRLPSRTENSIEEDFKQLSVKFLPPIGFSFTLPPDYPSTSPPRSCKSGAILIFLQLSRLCEKLDLLWEENKGLEILFLWLSFLKEESFNYLELGSVLNISKQYTYNIVQLEKRKKRLKSEISVEPSQEHAEVPQETACSSKSPSSSAKPQSRASNIFGGRGRGRGKTSPRERHQPARQDPGAHNDTSPNNQPNVGAYPSTSSSDFQSPESKSKYFASVGLDSRAVSCESLQGSLINHIIEYDKNQRAKEFQRFIYQCTICFDDKPGSQCIEFNVCGHIFCRDCIRTYFEVNIKEGNIHGLICPEKGCKSEALQSQISGLVSQELFARYDELLLSSALDGMEDIVYCPRKTCQYPVTYDKEERLARCAHCMYTFCALCRMGYHGIDPCRLKIGFAEYESASEEKKRFLEKKYGRKAIQDLLQTGYSEQWIKGNSKQCPHCQTAIEKADGCNKMTCWKCNTFFCWLCNTRLNPGNPYNHFNSPKSACFQMLFHGLRDSDSDSDSDTDEEFLVYLEEEEDE